MVQEHNPQSDLTVGCSNITQLQVSNPGTMPKARQFRRRPYADLSKFDRSVEPELQNNNALTVDFAINSRKFNSKSNQQQTDLDEHSQRSYDFLNSLNKSFLPGLGLGILVTSLLVLIWGATRLRQTVNSTNNHNHNNSSNNRRSSSPTATTCYAASEHIARLADAENGARYLKLQATTSL